MMKLDWLCFVFGIHKKWLPTDARFDDDWGGVARVDYCPRCGTVRRTYQSGKKEYLKLYYREYLSAAGAGVMLDYDTVLAPNKAEASRFAKAVGAYGRGFEEIVPVKSEHLSLNDKELSKLYGKKDVD